MISAVTTTQSKFEAYRPPTHRQGPAAPTQRRQRVDVQSEEMFPSLGDADKIEKLNNEEQKKQRAEEKAAPPPAPSGPVSQDV